MKKPSSRDIRLRFAALFERLLKQWDKENPEPHLNATTIYAELTGGRFKVCAVKLAEALNADTAWSGPTFVEVFTTVTTEAFRMATKKREIRRNRFELRLRDAMNRYQDRALFTDADVLSCFAEFEESFAKDTDADAA